MASLLVLQARAQEEREQLYREAAALCARFGIARSPDPPAVRVSQTEAQAHHDRALLLDLVRALAAHLDQDAAPSPPAGGKERAPRRG